MSDPSNQAEPLDDLNDAAGIVGVFLAAAAGLGEFFVRWGDLTFRPLHRTTWLPYIYDPL